MSIFLNLISIIEGKTTAINFREATPDLEHADNIESYECLINGW